MKTEQTTPTTVDEYIAGFPAPVQEVLQKIRATIRAAAPQAQEKFSYQIPGYNFHGNLIHFAAFEKHIGLYPAPSGSESFNQELSRYRSGKATVKFLLDEPIPYELITQIVRLRMEDNLR